MAFHTPDFLAFWLVVVGVVAAVRPNEIRKWVLLAASYAFCAWSSVLFLPPLLVATALTFVFTRRLAEATSLSARRAWLWASIAVNVSLLGFFKYAPSSVALPIGISFYTIQAIGYAVDVYRRPERGETRALDFALFLSFFPRLAAGPVLRSAAFLPQLVRRPVMRLDTDTLLLFLGGLIKKAIIADNLAPCVNGVFADPEHWPNPVVWLAVVAYTVQAYCDFSGYTDMAIAIGRTLGYRLPPNFDFPFFARNPSDFWRRWHISLSSWVRDYVFASLPGSRGGKGARWANTILMMLVFGLWHGATAPFLVWGLAHGLLLVAHDAYGTMRRRWNRRYQPATGPLATVASIGAMQLCVLLTMIPFRSPDLSAAWQLFLRFTFLDVHLSFAGAGLSDIQASRALILIVGFAVAHGLARSVGRLEEWMSRAPAPLAVLTCFAAAFLAYCLWPLDEPAFIYLRF